MKIIVVIVTFVLTCMIVPCIATTQSKVEGIKYYPSGDCGTGVKWVLNTDTGILDIRKDSRITSGEMDNYGGQNPPWYEYRDTLHPLEHGHL